MGKRIKGLIALLALLVSVLAWWWKKRKERWF